MKRKKLKRNRESYFLNFWKSKLSYILKVSTDYCDVLDKEKNYINLSLFFY